MTIMVVTPLVLFFKDAITREFDKYDGIKGAEKGESH